MPDLSPIRWQSRGSWRSAGATRTAKPAPLGRDCQRRLIKISTTAKSTAKIKVKPTWHRAGWVRFYDAYGQELGSRPVPLNQQTLMLCPLYTGRFRLFFTPVPWLPNLTVTVWEFGGSEADIAESEYAELLRQVETRINQL